MNGVSKADNKHRISLGKDVIEEYGEKFVIVRLPNEILLKPVPKDPLKALQNEGKKLKGVGWKKLRQEFEEDLRRRT
jgi:hypothetical protein